MGVLAQTLTKPRRVCGYQPVTLMISGRVAPFARFIMAMTSAFLLPRSAFGWPTVGLFARPAFFAGLAFLASFLLPLAGVAAGSGLPAFVESIVFVLICFSLPRLRSSQSSLRFGERASAI